MMIFYMIKKFKKPESLQLNYCWFYFLFVETNVIILKIMRAKINIFTYIHFTHSVKNNVLFQ